MSYTPSKLTALSSAEFTMDGSLTVIDTVGGVNLSHASNNSSYPFFGIYKTAPTAPYTLTVRMVSNEGYPEDGIAYPGIYVSDGTKYQFFCQGKNNAASGTMDMGVHNLSNNTTYFNSPSNFTTTMMGTVWLQLVDDNANRYWNISMDGDTFTTFFYTSRTNYLTPTRIGLGIWPYSEGLNVTYDSWKVT